MLKSKAQSTLPAARSAWGLDVEPHALSFIDEPVEVEFDQEPALEKVPHCPDRFVWRGQVYQVVEMLREWHDYRRRGKFARNMEPRHLATAARRGSWGVGRDYFRVRVEITGSRPQTPPKGGTVAADSVGVTLADPSRSPTRRVFDLYYDRAPSAGGPKGGWFLYREVSAE